MLIFSILWQSFRFFYMSPAEAYFNEQVMSGQKSEKPEISETAKRALAEAEERRKKQAGNSRLPKEIDGRDGPEPTRFGDWEKDGITSDF